MKKLKTKIIINATTDKVWDVLMTHETYPEWNPFITSITGTANVGETIIWEEGNASGAVTTTRIGTSSTGRPCREFQQSVTIGGKTEQAYGTACMNPDGSWEVVP